MLELPPQTSGSWLVTHSAWVHSPAAKAISLSLPWTTQEPKPTKRLKPETPLEVWLMVTRPSLGRVFVLKQVFTLWSKLQAGLTLTAGSPVLSHHTYHDRVVDINSGTWLGTDLGSVD